MSDREQLGIAARLRSETPVFSQSRLKVEGKIVRGSQVLMHYDGCTAPFMPGQSVYLETSEGTIHWLSVVRIGKNGKAYGTIGGEVEQRSNNRL